MRLILAVVVIVLAPYFKSAVAQQPIVGIPQIDPLIQAAIDSGEMPGAVVLIGTRDRILHFQAYGQRQVLPTPEPMTLDTIFDLASVTKPVATGTGMMLLIEQGKIDPAAPVSKYLPEFGTNGKESVTVSQLLTHTSGLIPDNHIRDYTGTQEQIWERICALDLRAPPGEKFQYSDVGFIVLGKLIERISGESLDQWVSRQIFQPLGMNDTGYCPPESLRERIAPTEKEGENWIRGTVHDPRARRMNGVAGHAGLFSSASDLSRYARMILHQGELDGVRVLKPETIDAMLVSRPVPGSGVRTWGWDRQTGFSRNKGKGMSERAIGHGGFTGTGLWIDPGNDLYVIFLSSRLHPDGKGAVNGLIGDIGTVAVDVASKNRNTGASE
jgi:Beta-lactamase class C and other penicillin binding proteins